MFEEVVQVFADEFHEEVPMFHEIASLIILSG